jgi:hypothetical protein
MAGAVHGAPPGRAGGMPRLGAARKIADEQVEVPVTRTLTEKGRRQGHHWLTRSMAAESAPSQSPVSRVWPISGRRSHRPGPGTPFGT